MSKVLDAPEKSAIVTPQEKSGWIVAALALAQLVSWGSVYYSFSLFIVPMEQELGWSRALINGAASLGLLVSGLCAYPIGHWIDRHGGRGVMAFGSVFATLMFLAWAQVSSPTSFFLLWIGFGIVMGATLYDPVFAIVTKRYPLSFRTKIIAITLVGGFASTVFIPLTQYWIDQLGWRHALLVLAACNAVICVPVHALVLKNRLAGLDDEAHHDDRIAARQAVHKALKHPTFWALMVCFTTYYAIFAAMAFHLVPLLLGRGIKTGVTMLAMALIGPSQVLARVVLLAIGNRLNTGLTGKIVFSLFSFSILLLIVLPDSTAGLFGTVLLYGAANGMITIMRGTAVPDLLWKEGYGAINGLIAFPSNVAKAAGPIGAALVWSAAGSYQVVLWVVLLISLLTLASFWVAEVYGRRGR